MFVIPGLGALDRRRRVGGAIAGGRGDTLERCASDRRRLFGRIAWAEVGGSRIGLAIGGFERNIDHYHEAIPGLVDIKVDLGLPIGTGGGRADLEIAVVEVHNGADLCARPPLRRRASGGRIGC